MINVTLRELDLATPALRKISQANVNAKTAFQIAKILSVIDAELKQLDKIRYDLFEKYSQHDENGKIQLDENDNVVVSKDNVEVFTKEFSELMATEVTLNIDSLDIELISGINLTPTEAGSILKFINVV
jgi:hypothetical protein